MQNLAKLASSLQWTLLHKILYNEHLYSISFQNTVKWTLLHNCWTLLHNRWTLLHICWTLLHKHKIGIKARHFYVYCHEYVCFNIFLHVFSLFYFFKRLVTCSFTFLSFIPSCVPSSSKKHEKLEDLTILYVHLEKFIFLF